LDVIIGISWNINWNLNFYFLIQTESGVRKSGDSSQHSNNPRITNYTASHNINGNFEFNRNQIFSYGNFQQGIEAEIEEYEGDGALFICLGRLLFVWSAGY
jgi:hypothetical protein